jgi:hypothetical protein
VSDRRTTGVAGAEPDGDLRITGGAGGTTACIEGLRVAAGRIARAAGCLSDAAALVRAALGRADQGAASSPVTAQRLHAEAAPLTSRSRGLDVRCDQLARTAARLRAAADTYERAEADVVGAVLRVVSIRSGYALGELGPLGLAAVSRLVGTGAAFGGTLLVAARLLRYTPTPVGLGLSLVGSRSMRDEDGVLGLVARMVGGGGLLPEDLGPPHGAAVEAALPGLAATFVGSLPGRVPLLDDPVRQVAALAAVVLSALPSATARGGLIVAPVVSAVGAREPRRDPTAPRDEADLLRQVESMYDSGGAGTVGVLRLDHDDGRRTWVVAIPGMQSFGAPGPGTTDLLSSFQLLSGQQDDLSETVVRAMLAAGVGPDEPVVLAGHSQGGMAAMRVAERTADMFTVTTVLTAGSPIGSMPVPDGVQVLSLEHDEDLVWGLDGRSNPDRPNHTTIRSAADPGSDGAGLLDRFVAQPGGGHVLEGYVATAEQVTGSEHLSVSTFEASLAGVLGDGTAEVTEQRYVGVRVPTGRRAGGPTTAVG